MYRKICWEILAEDTIGEDVYWSPLADFVDTEMDFRFHKRRTN